MPERRCLRETYYQKGVHPYTKDPQGQFDPEKVRVQNLHWREIDRVRFRFRRLCVFDYLHSAAQVHAFPLDLHDIDKLVEVNRPTVVLVDFLKNVLDVLPRRLLPKNCQTTSRCQPSIESRPCVWHLRFIAW